MDLSDFVWVEFIAGPLDGREYRMLCPPPETWSLEANHQRHIYIQGRYLPVEGVLEYKYEGSARA